MLHKKIEYFSIGEVEKYDFANNYKTVFGGVAIPIKEAILQENNQFIVFVLNHKEKKYSIGQTTSIRSYAYIICRIMNGQRSSGAGQAASKVIDKGEEAYISTEIIPASQENFDKCMDALKNWRCAGGREAFAPQDNLVLMRALHKATGWARYFTMQETRAHSIDSLRWNQLKIACKDIGPVNSLDVTYMPRDQVFMSKVSAVKAKIHDDIIHTRDFSFDIIKRATDLIGSKQLRNEVRSHNYDYANCWFTKPNIERLAEKLSTGKHGVEEPVVTVKVTPPAMAPAEFAHAATPVETRAQLEERLAAVNKQIENHAVTSKVELDRIVHGESAQAVQEETSVVEFELDGQMESHYTTQRLEHAKKISMLVTMIGMDLGLTVNSLSKVIADVVNASPMFVNLIGEVTPTIVENAIIHSTAPNPQQDFLFFEVINNVSKFIK